MSQDAENPVTFSFVAPVCNEQEGLEAFHQRLRAVAEQLEEPYEIVFVNDGSTDETPAILRRLAADDSRVRVVELSRNFGHQAALTAGYDHAAGRAVVCLDADGQHPPEVIPELVARWREGFEVVYSVRRDTAGISPLRRGIGRLVYGVIRLASGTDLTDQADFRLLDRKAVDALRAHREHARLLRGLVRWIGFRQAAVPYTAEARQSGSSSYSLGQLAAMAGAGVFNYSRRPLRLVPLLGVLLLAAALVYAVAAIVLWALGDPPGPWTSMTMAIAGLFGLQFLMLGIVAEYVGRTFEETKGRALYVVRDRIGFEASPPSLPPKRAPRRRPRGPGDINLYT